LVWGCEVIVFLDENLTALPKILPYDVVRKSFGKGCFMDKKDELIQMPTLSFPAYKEEKKPRLLLLVGGLVMVLGVVLVIMAAMNYSG
jgi:hypothetical protein